jgi:two-component system response regulator RegA
MDLAEHSLFTHDHRRGIAVNAVSHAEPILLVEDDSALRELLARYLNLAGYLVHEADCRAQALEVLAAQPGIQITLVNLGLPPESNTIAEGIRLLKQISLARPTVKNIVLSGQTDSAAIAESIRFCAFDFLCKPASMHALLTALKRARMFIDAEQCLSDRGIACLNISASVSDGIKPVTDSAEEKLLRKVLRDNNYNVNRSANLLGMKRESIYYFMKKFEIQRHDC